MSHSTDLRNEFELFVRMHAPINIESAPRRREGFIDDLERLLEAQRKACMEVIEEPGPDTSEDVDRVTARDGIMEAKP